MPIQVTCSGCKATFNVSEKYAGRQGPCPKCKAVITIPKLEAAKKVEEVKIAAPDEVAAGSGKTATGQPISKPIERRDAKLSPIVAGVVVAIILVMFLAAWLVGPSLLAPAPLLPEERSDPALSSAYGRQWWTTFSLRGAGLLIIGLPIIWAGYLVLRDDELEPFRGQSLLIRSLICFVVYSALWGVYGLIPDDVASSGYAWLYLAPPFFIVGFVTAYYCFEFDVTSAAFHYIAFVTLTLMLGMTAGLTMPWSAAPRYRPSLAPQRPGIIYGEDGKPIELRDEGTGEPTETPADATPP